MDVLSFKILLLIITFLSVVSRVFVIDANHLKKTTHTFALHHMSICGASSYSYAICWIVGAWIYCIVWESQVEVDIWRWIMCYDNVFFFLIFLLGHKTKKLTQDALRTKEDSPTSRGGGIPRTRHTTLYEVTKSQVTINTPKTTPKLCPTKDRPHPTDQRQPLSHWMTKVSN